MFYIPLVFVILAGVFYAGKRYGSSVEAKAIGLSLNARSYIANTSADAYKVVIADIKAAESSVLSRLQSALRLPLSSKK